MKKMITELDYLRTAYKFAMERIEDLEEENKKLKNSIEYWKRKADKNQEKAKEIDRILKIPWILKEDWKIDRPKVAFSHII